MGKKNPIKDRAAVSQTSEEIILRFSLVFVAALGFADAVLPLPVQDLLQLFLLPADTRPTAQPVTQKRPV